MTLETVLAPYDGSAFIKDVLGKAALHEPGPANKFRELFSWQALNHVMKFGGMHYPRLRLIRDGQELPATSYLGPGASGYPRPLVREINAALRQGATVAIESIEELHEPVSRLCELMEQRLEIPMQVDLYANWVENAPSTIRWNEHDVIVLQVEGKRTWRVYGPTANYATADCAPPKPVGDPSWEGLLEAGGLLYIPQGWWYCDQTVESALYLAMKFRNYTGADVLRRIFDHLVRSAELRVPCARFDTPAQQSAFIRTFQQEVMTACTSSGLLLGFLKDSKALAEPRVGFNFPWSVVGCCSEVSENLLVVPLTRFSGADSVRQSRQEDAVELFLNGNVLRLQEYTGKVLMHLSALHTVSVAVLLRVLAREMTRDQLFTAVAELIELGLAELREPELGEHDINNQKSSFVNGDSVEPWPAPGN
jgi:hypothetical protein